MQTFKVELTRDFEVVFKDDELSLDQLQEKIEKHIGHSELHPSAIVEEVRRSNGAACSCGSIRRGYRIAQNMPDNKYVHYYFGKDQQYVFKN